jgi:hypothetical protein
MPDSRGAPSFRFRQNARRCKRQLHPRRADARRSCFDSRDSPDTIRCALPARPNATHGGLTPAALVSRSDFRRIMPDSRGVPSYRSRQKRPPLQAPIAPTAGSRPPLL